MSWTAQETPRCYGFATVRAEDSRTAQPRGSVALRSQHVRAVVSGGLAHTEVEFELENEQTQTVDGHFSYLLSPSATLSRFALRVGEQWVEAGQDDAFDVGIIHHFATKQRRKVLLAYDDVLEQFSGRRAYRYAMSGACALEHVRELSIEVVLLGDPASFGAITTPRYDAVVQRKADRTTLRFEGRSIVPNGDFAVELERSPTTADVQLAGPIQTATPEKPGYASIGFDVPANVTSDSGSAPTTRVLVLDTSYHRSRAELELERRIALEALKQGTPQERYRLLTCDSACRKCPLDAASGEAAASRASDCVSSLEPSGTLDLEGAFAQAASLVEHEPRGQIIYLGGGRISAGALETSQLFESVARRLTHASIDLRVFAIGQRRDDSVLFGLASRVAGTFAVLSDAQPSELAAHELLRSIRSPKLVDVRVELPSGLVEAAPASWPAVVLGQPLRIATRVRGTYSGAFRLTGKLDGRDYAHTYPITLDGSTRQNAAVERWWTRERSREAELKVPPGFVADTSAPSRRIHKMRETSASSVRSAAPTLVPRTTVTASPVRVANLSSVQEADADRQREIQVLRSSFRRCYERHAFGPSGWFEGRVEFVLQLDARASPGSRAAVADGGDIPRPLLDCLRAAAAEATYEPPKTGPLELLFSAQFAIDWSQGLRADVPVPPEAFSGYGPIMTSIVPSDATSPSNMALDSSSTVLNAPTVAQMLAEARQAVERAPHSASALELLAVVAGAHQERDLMFAAMEAELALSPRDRELQLRVAGAWLAAGDERRASAHSRAASTLPMPLLTQGSACQPFVVSVSCDSDSQPCPTPLVFTPDGRVVSPFGRIPGVGSATPLSFSPGVLGTYRLFLLGGKPLTRGSVELGVHLETKRWEVVRAGVAQNVASITLSAEQPSPNATGIPMCGAKP